MLSTDLRLALAPVRTYRGLVAEPAPAGWFSVLAPVVLSLLTIGVFVSTIAAHRVTLGLVLTSALSWSFAVVVQTMAAIALIYSARDRAVSARRAYQLFFLAHVPWSFLMLGVSAYSLIWNPVMSSAQMVLAAPIAIGWTSVLVSAFCQTVLGTSKAGARLRAAAHQAVIVLSLLLYIVWSAGGLRNVLVSVGR